GRFPKKTEARCAKCNGVLAVEVMTDKTNHGALCLACVARLHNVPFSLRLKSYRVAAGLSRSQLAQRAGVTYNLIGIYDRGYAGLPRKFNLQKLIRALGLGLSGVP